MDTSPDRSTLLIWRIRALLAAACVMFVAGGVAVFNSFAGFAAGGITLVLFSVYAVFYAPLLFKKYCYVLKEDSITIKKGLFFSYNILVSKSRIQYTEIHSTPVQNLLKVCSACLYTAGADIKLGLLKTDEAEKIIKRLG